MLRYRPDLTGSTRTAAARLGLPVRDERRPRSAAGPRADRGGPRSAGKRRARRHVHGADRRHTHVAAAAEKPQPVNAGNVQTALAFLEQAHLIGALDLGQALNEAAPLLKAAKAPLSGACRQRHCGDGRAARRSPRQTAAGRSALRRRRRRPALGPQFHEDGRGTHGRLRSRRSIPMSRSPGGLSSWPRRSTRRAC